MKTIIIILGLAATQIQERSKVDLDIPNLYDVDARRFRGPVMVRYQLKDVVIELPESALVSLSFDMGILTSADITPHSQPLDGAETAKLCEDLAQMFMNRGFVFSQSSKFKEFTEGLKQGHVPADSLPPWRFGWKLEGDRVNIVIRPFESSRDQSPHSNRKQYTIMLEFGNSQLSETVYQRLKATKAKHFPHRQERILMSEYPKE